MMNSKHGNKEAISGQGLAIIYSKSDEMLPDFRLGTGGRKECGSENNNLKFEGHAGIDPFSSSETPAHYRHRHKEQDR